MKPGSSVAAHWLVVPPLLGCEPLKPGLVVAVAPPVPSLATVTIQYRQPSVSFAAAIATGSLPSGTSAFTIVGVLRGTSAGSALPSASGISGVTSIEQSTSLKPSSHTQ